MSGGKPNGKPDETNIGHILIAMGLCTPGQVARAVEAQRAAAKDKRVGMFLVADGFVSREQLEMALNAQVGLRSRKRHLRALAQADIAQQSSAAVLQLSGRIRSRTAEVRRATTGGGHPAITEQLLAAKDK